jgi:hypothetical protein
MGKIPAGLDDAQLRELDERLDAEHRAHGKGRPPPGAETELLAPVDGAPDFRARHPCRAAPEGLRVVQIPPYGWQVRGRGRFGIPVDFCPWCGLQLD